MFSVQVTMMQIIVFLCVSVLVFGNCECKTYHPDVGLSVPELIGKYGYPVETYFVQTEDSYILQMHRIPHGRKQKPKRGKPVVFLMHGLLGSSADWILMGPETSLAYILADMGYDVWMGNARGNTYSRNHTTLDADKDAGFWDFSWHEIGGKDLPAMIEAVLYRTGQNNLYYIGHSQGTTAAFVLTSSLPIYNDKIRLIIALAPTAHMKHVPNTALRLIARFHKITSWVTSMLGVNEFLPSTKFIKRIGENICNDNSIAQGFCSNVLFCIAGFNRAQLNTTMLPVILNHIPAGAATKQLIHFAQLIKSGNFQKYDYGYLKNIAKYGSLWPATYNIEKISCPVALIYGNNDLLSSEKDIYKLSQDIKNVVLLWKVEDPNFSHLDFLWSIDIKTLLHTKIFELLQEY